jgi:aliphatic nitrilase
MPLARHALYAKGEQIHVANWPGANFAHQPRDRSAVIDAAMRNIGFEGQVFVVFSSSCVGPEEVDLYHREDPATKDVLKPGGGIAGIISPYGAYLAGPIEHDEGLAVAEIDLNLIREAKMIVDTVGHYGRNDIFTLKVDDSPKPGVVFGQNAAAAQSDTTDLWTELKNKIKALADDDLIRTVEDFERKFGLG